MFDIVCIMGTYFTAVGTQMIGDKHISRKSSRSYRITTHGFSVTRISEVIDSRIHSKIN